MIVAVLGLPDTTLTEQVPSGRVISAGPGFAYEALLRIFKSASSAHPSTNASVFSPFVSAKDACPSPIEVNATVVAIPNITAEMIKIVVMAINPFLYFIIL